MKQGDYITILAPMVSELKLSGNNLIVFALIHGFCKDDSHKFTGSIDYICRWTNLSRPTVIETLKALVRSGYLEKNEQITNGVKFCSYSSNYENILRGSKETLPVVKKLNEGSKETLLNIYNDNNNDKSLFTNNNAETKQICFVEIKNKWEELNPNLPTIRDFSHKRKKALTTLLKNNNATIDDLYKAFKVISICSFCQGNNDRKWTATLDWLLNDTKSCFNRLLEGAYAFNDNEKREVAKIIGNATTTIEESETLIINGQIYK